VSAVTPEARQQAIDLLSSIYPMDVHDSFGRAAVDALIAAGWSPPVTPEARELDPLPWRCFDCGRNMTGPADRGHDPSMVHLSPRPEFDQDPAHYPEGGKP
jgi:hypothetical protein